MIDVRRPGTEEIVKARAVCVIFTIAKSKAQKRKGVEVVVPMVELRQVKPRERDAYLKQRIMSAAAALLAA